MVEVRSKTFVGQARRKSITRKI